MSLIRYDGATLRTPSPSLWRGIVDWVAGMDKLALGQRDFEDYAPYLGDAVGQEIQSTTGTPTIAIQTDEPHGILNITDTAGTNEAVGLAREIWYDLDDWDVMAVECRFEQKADADSPQVFLGFSDVANPDDVWGAAVIASGSNQDTVGLRWNADETVDIIAVDDGTLATLKDDIGASIERTDGLIRLGLKIEKMSDTQCRLTPYVNGSPLLAGAVNVALTSLPQNPMRPVIATLVAETTAPQIEIDWIATGSK